ncbi:beta strand repeat-containing protein, partial [Komagataeibacter swingsii]
MSGFGTLNKDGTGEWVVGTEKAPLTSLSPTLAVNVNDGTLVLAGDTSVTQATVKINSGGTLQLGQGGTTGWIDGITYDNGTLAFDRSDTNTFASDIANNTSLDPAGKGGVVQEGTGTTILTGTNTYSGGTVITAGTLQIGDGGTSGSITGNVTNDSNLVFDRSDATTFAGDISGSGNVSQIGAGAATLSGVISGTQSLTQAGTGSTILTNADTYSGTTTISQGSLQLGDGQTSGTIANTAAIVDNGNLTVDNPAATTLSQVISGTGSLTQSGSGTTTLTSVDTYSGATTIQNGTLALDGAGSIAASDGVHDNGTFDVSGVSASGTTVNALDGSGALVLGDKNLTIADGNTTFGNVFSGQASGTGGSLTIASGTETLSGANSYTGGTTVDSGAGLDLTGSVGQGTVSNAGTLDVAGGTVGGDISNTGTATLTNGIVTGALDNGAGATATATGGTIGSVVNEGALTLGAGNTVSGNVTNGSSGTLTLDGDTVDGTVADNGTLAVTANGGTAGSLSGSGAGTLAGGL